MKFRFISPTLHGVADYSAGVGLILAPFVLGLGSVNTASHWISVVTGIAVLAVSLLTNYKLGAFRRIPFQGHLAIDLVVAIAFMILPFALGFTGMEANYYLFNAAVVFTVVSLSENDY
ncbi:SPW repeat domain-containing protein [Pontimicrobium aquaticum]|uniref:SPW repeat-containing integral membrane domain-containing protein n=1 Tax=Pontimicrobium aquaticum TaxID=2565367 RepID=A0A4U0EW98_9FLAO|nr:hypothetical protein [Pontimicrobium aquaticum]TJY36028.1 hypothetical protein E5167_09205 [Pontimicrobium aquaticum]